MTTSISPSSPTPDSAIAQTSEGFSSDEFDALDHILDDIRTRDDEAPQWEFCEGFMAAVLCSRRPIATDEAWEVLLGSGDGDGDIAFKDAAQRQQFLDLWLKRQGEVHRQLDADITALDDDAAYSPEVMDVRGAIATLPADERAAIAEDDIPSFAQVWGASSVYVGRRRWPRRRAQCEPRPRQWFWRSVVGRLRPTESMARLRSQSGACASHSITWAQRPMSLRQR